MIEHIIRAKDRKFSDLESIKNAKLPVVMYGAGSYAVDVTRFLAKHDVVITAYAIDAAYLSPDMKQIGSTPVIALDQLQSAYGKATIVIGFDDYVKARKTLHTHGFDDAYFIDAPNQFGFFDYSYIEENIDAFNETFELLADDESREVFIAFINAKISGDPSGLYTLRRPNQYFGEPTKLSEHESLVDCGAYDGDTISNFLKNVQGKYDAIYTFEPDPNNYTKLLSYIEAQALQNVQPFNAGCWSNETTLHFSMEGNMAAIVADEGDTSIAVTSVDSALAGKKATIIKMDIEGAELEALIGSKATIETFHPKLTICAYHKPYDLITLPQYIRSISNDYKFYLRHHQFMSWEMVLYAL